MAEERKYKVWTCKLVVVDDENFKHVTDAHPRKGAIGALPTVVEVVGCFSGWDGKLTQREKDYIEELERARANV